MSAPLTMYIVSNGELVRSALNAVVTLVGSTTFSTAIKLSILFSIFGAAINYIRGQDLVAFGKWFFIYFGITVIMLGPKVPLAIYDISSSGKTYVVGNVPYGLAFPASFITSVSYGLVQAVEEAFQMPDDVQYHKTGMLFGSKLFKISTEFNIVNPQAKIVLNEYVKNCVLGDMLIVGKYPMSELTESTDIFKTITNNPSKIRGIYVEGKFKSCEAAVKDLEEHLKQGTKDNIFKHLARRLGWGSQGQGDAKTKSAVAEAGKNALKGIYRYFNYGELSNSALEIVTQNLLINGIRRRDLKLYGGDWLDGGIIESKYYPGYGKNAADFSYFKECGTLYYSDYPYYFIDSYAEFVSHYCADSLPA